MICLGCKKEFDVDMEPGAILLSPPSPVLKVYDKHHICQKCYPLVLAETRKISGPQSVAA